MRLLTELAEYRVPVLKSHRNHKTVGYRLVRECPAFYEQAGEQNGVEMGRGWVGCAPVLLASVT